MGRLGDTLRDRRHALGMSLPRAEKALRIRIEMLEALEAGDYETLPAPGYVRGYITSYARLLELDPQPLLSMYKSETGARRFSSADGGMSDAPVAPFGMQHHVPFREAAIVVAVVVVVSALGWFVWRMMNGPSDAPPEPVTITTTTASVDATGPVVDTTEKPAATSQFTLVVSVKPETVSWVDVTVDGKRAYAGTLVSGQSKRFEVTDQAVVSMGKPESVRMTRDGKNVSIPRGTSSITLSAVRSDD